MKNIKVCSFVSSYTHSLIVTNNFISKEYDNAKVIYINQNSEKEKLDKIVNKYFRSLNKKIIYMEWLNEEIVNDYINENIVLVVNGSESFISRVNEYFKFVEPNIVVINCYNVMEIKSSIKDIISRHDYYLNTQGIQVCKDKTCKIY